MCQEWRYMQPKTKTKKTGAICANKNLLICTNIKLFTARFTVAMRANKKNTGAACAN